MDKQESPQIVGLRPPMRLQICYAGKLQCESTEYFGPVATKMTSQRLSVQSAGPSVTL